GGVARVGERWRPGLLEGAIHLRELGARHEYLAPYLERRRAHEGSAQYHRNGPDRPEVRGNFLADAAIASGCAPDEPAGLVHERDAESVDLRLAHVRKCRRRQRPANAGLELA